MNEDVLAPQEGYLVSLAAAVAAGCVPCAGYYVERARAAGVGDAAMREAIAAAESVRRLATEDCVRRVKLRLGDTDIAECELPQPGCDEEFLRFLAAAYAVNSHRLVTRLLERARAGQMPEARLLEAAHIARGIRGMAIAIVERGLPAENADAQGPSCLCEGGGNEPHGVPL